MTIVAQGHATANLSGRELALQRRQAMARHGKSGATKAMASASRNGSGSVMNAVKTAYREASTNPSTSFKAQAVQRVESLAAAALSPARARRQALSTVGKASIQAAAAPRPSAHLRPGAAAKRAADCGCSNPCGCQISNPTSQQAEQARSVLAGHVSAVAPAPGAQVVQAAAQAGCATGRALAKMRRASLAQDGKAGLKRVAQATKIAAMPGQDWQTAMLKGATARQVAMQRRLVQSLAGRVGVSTNSPSRPTGRVKAHALSLVPSKVEEGHTLAGQPVTGTMVERSGKVTGNEPGSCRNITGTEYVGTEQFQTICGVRPEPGVPKVAVGMTLREKRITGTALGRSTQTTGDEHGACRPITGTEYLSAERFEQFCATRPSPAPAKVAVVSTEGGQTLTGSLVDRPRKITGTEFGADRALTGTRYSRAETDDAPEKVAQTHTAAGKLVTGTAVGRGERLTGNEAGSCRPISGTEYLSAEQFRDQCHTAAPSSVRKVSVMSTREDQTVSGTAVDRSGKVTGNEVGSCRAISGSQYYTTADFAGLCETATPKKVSSMQTLGGRGITGSEVAPSPKLSGDESFGCKPVTGTDYIGTRQLAAVCPTDQAPVIAPVRKVVVDSTLRGQTISGSYAGRAQNVTGNEAGTCASISGASYTGQGQYQAFCSAPSIASQAARVRDSAVIPATVVTGDRPGAGGSPMTGDERGACEPVSGTPYLGADNMPQQCAVSNRFVSRARTFDVAPRPAAPKEFSIQSPARVAHERQAAEQSEAVTGSAMSTARITGPSNKADGLITGTPEFRHGDNTRRQAQQEDVLAAAQRLSGEGSQQGRRVSGDAWDGSTRVTGTEGSSSLKRNLSMRGEPRGAGTSAMKFREIERPEIPDSVITGSAGNTNRGATVTLSGGARG